MEKYHNSLPRSEGVALFERQTTHIVGVETINVLQEQTKGGGQRRNMDVAKISRSGDE
jgi:hypothetical protein